MFDAANGETDVDCGGPNCSPCANDDGCSVATDCVSGVCDSSNTGQCKPCDGSGNFDCQAGDYCDATNVCTALKMLGDACVQADVCSDCSLGDQCPNDFCVDGFCCDTGCANECDSCNVGGSEGTCSPSPMGTTCGDPSDTECTNPDSCDGAAVTCQDNHETDGTTCTIGGTMCSGGACI